MPSHFSTIGIPLRSDEDLHDLVNRAAEEAEEIACKNGRYLRWASAEGAELWLQIDKDDELVGMTPYFRGSSELLVRITGWVARPDDTPLEGAAQGWAAPQGDDPESGAYPFVFDLVDRGLHEGVEFPFISPVRLCAFAHELDVYGSDEDYEASQQGGVTFASESFIPSGLFGQEDGAAEPPRSHAMFTGHVLEAKQLSNSLTGSPYQWLRVRTLGGEIDVVADPALLARPPSVGGVVSGSFWLCGRIVTPSPARGAGGRPRRRDKRG